MHKWYLCSAFIILINSKISHMIDIHMNWYETRYKHVFLACWYMFDILQHFTVSIKCNMRIYILYALCFMYLSFGSLSYKKSYIFIWKRFQNWFFWCFVYFYSQKWLGSHMKCKASLVYLYYHSYSIEVYNMMSNYFIWYVCVGKNTWHCKSRLHEKNIAIFMSTVKIVYICTWRF